MLKAEGVFKSYGDLPVLKGINLNVKRGEIISIVGASGAGKSTLLHILGTLDDADRGEVIINNNKISGLNRNAKANFRNREVGFVFQFHNLLPEFTALENISIPAFIGNTKQVEKRAIKLMETLGVVERKDHKPSELSGGEQQRVAVARALINNPSIIFADEPSGNLDSNTAEDLHNLFFKLRKEFDQTFVIVTHNEELANMADRKLEIKDGQIIS